MHLMKKRTQTTKRSYFFKVTLESGGMYASQPKIRQCQSGRKKHMHGNGKLTTSFAAIAILNLKNKQNNLHRKKRIMMTKAKTLQPNFESGNG